MEISKPLKASTNLSWPLLMVISLFYFLCASAFAKQHSHVDGNKVLFVISSDKHGYWLPEVLEPFQLLQQAGFDVDIASPKGGEGTIRGSFQLSKKQTTWFNNSALKDKLASSMVLSVVDSSHYVAVYFAGGAGPMFDLVNNRAAQKVTREIYEAGGIVSADCHGPVALVNVTLSNGQRLILGKKITGKANVEEGRWARNNYPFLLQNKLTEVGGKYSAKAKGQVHVVVDYRIITGQNPASAVPMTEELIKQLSTLTASAR